MNCPTHGPTVAQVPWARHGAGHTRSFDDQCAWLVTHTPKSTVSALMRIAWRSVGSIVSRVVADGRAAHDPFDGLARIGIDEISYKKGHRYLTIVVDHDTGRLVWAAIGRDKDTLRGFFDLLGAERSARIRLVSADAAEWIGPRPGTGEERHLVHRQLPRGVLGDRGLGQLRREVWNEARKGGLRSHAKELKGCRYALWRNPEDLTPRQERKLAWIATVNKKLYRAYLTGKSQR